MVVRNPLWTAAGIAALVMTAAIFWQAEDGTATCVRGGFVIGDGLKSSIGVLRQSGDALHFPRSPRVNHHVLRLRPIMPNKPLSASSSKVELSPSGSESSTLLNTVMPTPALSQSLPVIFRPT
jgi:hypothetical protein